MHSSISARRLCSLCVRPVIFRTPPGHASVASAIPAITIEDGSGTALPEELDRGGRAGLGGRRGTSRSWSWYRIEQDRGHRSVRIGRQERIEIGS